MASYSVFDKLVSGLSSNERRDMLERIASAVTLGPPDEEPEQDRVVDLNESFAQMGVFRRLIIIVTAFFSGRERNSIVEGYLLRDLSRRVNAALPGGLDAVQLALRPAAIDDFRKLSEDARVFSGILGRVMGKEHRSFVAFLAGLHAPDAQRQLVDDTDPFSVGGARPELSLVEVKRHTISALEGIVTTLSPKIRQRIYTDVRAAHHMMALSSFPFDRVIGAFEGAPGAEPIPAPLARLSEDLVRLANVFQGLRQEASPVLFQALSFYQEQDRLEESDEKLEAVVTEEVNQFSSAYQRIREFRKAYPIPDLVRLARSDINFKAVPGAGGEDWFAQWKGFWRDRIESQHRRYSYDRRLDGVVAKATELLNGRQVRVFPGYPPTGLDRPARHGLSAGLMSLVLGEVADHEILGPTGEIFREGEFYKADNRTDFDRAWSDLQQVKTEVANMEVRLRPTGDLGISWKQAQDDSLPAEAAEERQLSIIARIDSDASALLHRCVDTLRLLGEILQGVLYGTVGGRYDTISNLGELGGRDPAAFIKRLERAHVLSKGVADLLSDLQNVESLAGQ